MSERVRMRILVVEDDEDAAELAAEFLARAGHEVSLAHSAAAALELARSMKPQVAFVDLGLPDMDGADLGPLLKTKLDGLRLIALSGYGSEDTRLRALGFDQCLLKPAAGEALVCAAEGRPLPS